MSQLSDFELDALEREGFRHGQKIAAVQDAWTDYLKTVVKNYDGVVAVYAGFIRAVANGDERLLEGLAASIASGICASGVPVPDTFVPAILERLRRRSSSNPPPQSDPPS